VVNFPSTGDQIQGLRMEGNCSSTELQTTDHYIIFLLLLLGLGLELRASHLQSQHPTTWATPPVHFALFILEMGGIMKGWHQTSIVPISASQVARITGVSHWHSALFHFVSCFCVSGTGVWTQGFSGTGIRTCQAGTLLLEPLCQPCILLFKRGNFCKPLQSS
jgi:hypothetical protein